MMRYYGIPAFKKGEKSHLAYMDAWGGCVSQVCLPNIPIWGKWSPCNGGNSFIIGREDIEYWDTMCGEITCPTCLKRALTGVRLPK